MRARKLEVTYIQAKEKTLWNIAYKKTPVQRGKLSLIRKFYREKNARKLAENAVRKI